MREVAACNLGSCKRAIQYDLPVCGQCDLDWHRSDGPSVAPPHSKRNDRRQCPPEQERLTAGTKPETTQSFSSWQESAKQVYSE